MVQFADHTVETAPYCQLLLQVIIGFRNPFNYGKEVQEKSGNKAISVAEKLQRLMCLGVLHSWRVNCIEAPAIEFEGTNFHGTKSKVSTEFVSGDEEVTALLVVLSSV